jgi:hypothetical protein
MDTNITCTPPAEALPPTPPDAIASGPPSRPPVTAPPRRRRWRRWLVVLGILAFVAALPLLLYAFFCWASDHAFDAAVADVERVDPRWRFDDINADRPPIADADNPALVIGKVNVLIRRGGNFGLGEKEYQLFELNDNHFSPPHRLNVPQTIALRKEIEKHAEAVKLARTLKDFRGEGRFVIIVTPDWISTTLEPLQNARNVMAMLQYDAWLRAEDDDAAGAFESCRAGLVAARSIGDEPFLIAMLIRVAGQALFVQSLERTLAQCENPPPAELKAIQQLLAREIEAPILLNGVRGERAGVDKIMERVADGSMRPSALTGAMRMGGGVSFSERLLDLFPGVVATGRAELLRLTTEAVEAAKLPAHEQKEAFDKVEKATRSSSAIPVRLLAPALAKVSQAYRRAQANMRSALAVLAIERYRLEHGAWPDSLADVVKAGLLDAVPLDPIDGQPLRYKRLADGVVVYSVGMDGVDNGGMINRENPLTPGSDLGVRLWDVEHRRQQPLPPPLDNGERR